MKAKYFVMLFAGIELFLGVGSFNTGIAHFAHLGGALFGLIISLLPSFDSVSLRIIYFFGKKCQRTKNKSSLIISDIEIIKELK